MLDMSTEQLFGRSCTEVDELLTGSDPVTGRMFKGACFGESPVFVPMI